VVRYLPHREIAAEPVVVGDDVDVDVDLAPRVAVDVA
jgi:hypothetical protein